MKTTCENGHVIEYNESDIVFCHRLLCGDSTNADDVARVMAGEKADAMLSDPPYGMRLDTAFSFSKDNADMAIKATKGYSKVIGDEQDFDARFIFTQWPDLKEMFLFGADYYVDCLPDYGKRGSWMVWDKKNESLREVLGLADFELIWTKQRHKRRVYQVLWNGALGTESEDTKGRVHPTQKPVKLLTKIIEEYIPETMIVIDPFGGGGGTMVACEQLARQCCMIEIDPRYVSVILQRLADMGLQPKLSE